MSTDEEQLMKVIHAYLETPIFVKANSIFLWIYRKHSNVTVSPPLKAIHEE